jgi:CRP-like cAMP-binding protein
LQENSFLNIQTEDKRGILNRLADGSLSLTSAKEYQELMSLFPDKGEISRAYGDFLSKRQKKNVAFQSYTQATQIFLSEGKTFQAIVSKILAWSIFKPTHAEGRAFHSALQTSIKEESPLQHLFSNMAYQELIGLMLRLVRVQFDAGHTIIQSGQDCDDIFFVVSGTLEEKAAQTNRPEPLTQHLFDNDIFGDVFPMHEKTTSLVDVKTITPVEVVKISKTVLMETCLKYPRLEKLLEKLYKGPPSWEHGRSWSSVRRSARHDHPIRTTVRMALRKDDSMPVAFEGVSRDISLGGACIDLGLKYGSLRTEALAGAKSLVEIKLPSNNGVSIPGWVAWSKKIQEPGGASIIAGIKFDPLSDDARDFLKVYCFGYESEESLMWGLWEDYLA